MNTYFVYMMTNRYNTVLYIGVTGNLERRIYEHKHKTADGFTKQYNIDKLVYVEESTDIEAAIKREKQLKKWSRTKKNALVERVNPKWNDLSGWSEDCDGT